MKDKTKNPKVCVIGAGCSGIAAIKNLVQAGVEDVVCFEKGDAIGGNWRFTAGESHSSVCETTHIISSKTMSEYLDFPMPASYPGYPSHKQVPAYFEDYARHFGVEQYIRFNAEVKKVEKMDAGKWRVMLAHGEEQVFDYLLVANGHHSVPRHPALPGEFEGEFLHAHAYKTNGPFCREEGAGAGRRQFPYFELQSYRDNDQKFAYHIVGQLRGGDLVIRDLGYDVLGKLRRSVARQV